MARILRATYILFALVAVILPRCLHGRPTYFPGMTIYDNVLPWSVQSRLEFDLRKSNDYNKIKQSMISKLQQEDILSPAKLRHKRQSDLIMADINTRIAVKKIAEENGWRITESFNNILGNNVK